MLLFQETTLDEGKQSLVGAFQVDSEIQKHMANLTPNYTMYGAK